MKTLLSENNLSINYIGEAKNLVLPNMFLIIKLISIQDKLEISKFNNLINLDNGLFNLLK